MRSFINLVVVLLGTLSLLLASAVSISAQDPSQENTRALSLTDLERIALANNPTLVQASAQIEVARSKALQAGLYPNPTVGYVGDQIGIEGTAGEMQGAFIQQTIVTAGKLRLSRAKYQQQAVVAEILAMAQQLRVVNGVQSRFYALLATHRMLQVRRDSLKNAEESLRTHKEMLNTGLANKSDVLLAEIENNRAKIALQAQENHYLSSWESLSAILGVDELPATQLAGNLETFGPPLEWVNSLRRLLADSPEIQAARAHVVYDDLLLQREKVEPIPNVDVTVSSGYNFETNDTVAGVQIGVRLPIWNRNQGTIQQARAELARSQAEVRRVELSLRRRLAIAFNHYRTAFLTAQMYRNHNVPKAKEAHDVMLDMYKKRRVAWMEVVKLQRNLYAIESEYTQSLLNLRQAEIAIKGMLVVDGLTAPAAPTPSGHLEATPTPR